MNHKHILLLTISSAIIISLCAIGINKQHISKVNNMPINGIIPDNNNNVITVVIDPGHGGYDPGKVSADGIPEKEINLSISLYLRTILEGLHYNVILTRTDDSALCSEESSTRKTDDLNNRIKITEENRADYVISIHQNSFSDPSVHGAQVFYYSEGVSKKLAEAIQLYLDPERNAASNKSYYMLKKTSCPTVIAECGFLSNPSEAAMLNDSEYRKNIAARIAQGFDSYINSN